MAEHKATILWNRGDAVFTDNRYSRGHVWRFDGGIEVPASSSPQAAPPPLSVAEAVDPEEALVAALSSCHMLWFLWIAAKRGFVVESYRDEAVGILDKNPEGKRGITQVTLRPKVVFGGQRRPSPDEFTAMHHEAHQQCYIANSIKSQVRLEPVAE